MQLRVATAPEWVTVVLGDMDAFLVDHAACERKASGLALSLVCHYPDKPELVRAMSELAVEELAHFREVVKWLQRRGLTVGRDEKDPYVNGLRNKIRTDSQSYLLDRLIMFGIVEQRGQERFSLLGDALGDDPMGDFYRRLAAAEGRHFATFFDLAERYWAPEQVAERRDALLDVEADLVRRLPIRVAVH